MFRGNFKLGVIYNRVLSYRLQWKGNDNISKEAVLCFDHYDSDRVLPSHRTRSMLIRSELFRLQVRGPLEQKKIVRADSNVLEDDFE